MLKEQVLQQWKSCKEKVFKLQKKSIDKYPKVRKLTLLELSNSPVNFNNDSIKKSIDDIWIENGSITRRPTNYYSNFEVTLLTELLEVIVLKTLSNEEEGIITNTSDGPNIEEVD